MSEKRVLRIRELDPDMIAPSTSSYGKASQGGSKIVVIGKPGCFIAGTKILMYDGSVKNVEDVRVGDLVMGDDSTPRNVLELCRDSEMMYEIRPYIQDKYLSESYIVNANHKLVLKNNTNDIFEIKVKNYINMHDKHNYRIYKTSIEFSEIILDNDPYTFGLNVNNNNIIPYNYKVNSRYNRLQLLKGIIEANSTKVNDCIIINLPLDELLNDVIFVSRSLGFECYRNKENKNIIELYGYSDNLNDIPSKNIDFEVLEYGIDNYYGFTLDGNHRFLLASFDVVRNTGKTTLISSLLYEKSHIYPSGLIFSGTEDSNHHYSTIFPSTFVYNRYDKEKLKDYIKRQKIAKEHLENPWSVLLLDDCTDDPKIFNDPLFQGIFKNGRHWKMWFILSLQYCLDVKPVIRTNIDGTFILRETNLRNRKALWENYAGVIPDFSDFCDIMDQLTNDYTALYIHNATTSNKIEDCMFWYKAKPIPPDFRFGCDDFWAFHNGRYNPNYIDPIVI
jgi:hypothetical protein